MVLHLKVCNSVVFPMFTKLYIHHHYLILEHFHYPPQNLVPISSHSLFLLSSTSHNYCTFCFYGSVYARYFICIDHLITGLWWLTFLIEHNIYKIHPCCSMYQYFIPFYGQIIFHCMDDCIYLFIWQTFVISIFCLYE